MDIREYGNICVPRIVPRADVHGRRFIQWCVFGFDQELSALDNASEEQEPEDKAKAAGE